MFGFDERKCVDELMKIYGVCHRGCEPELGLKLAARGIELVNTLSSWPKEHVVPFYWLKAALHNLYGRCYAEIHNHNPEYAEKALKHFELANEGYSQEAPSTEWALNIMLIANAYMDWHGAEYNQNIKIAIKHYQLALNYLEATEEELKLRVMHALAVAYSEVIDENDPLTIEKGIVLYEECLAHINLTKDKQFYTELCIDFSQALLNRHLGNRAENRERGKHLSMLAMQLCSTDEDKLNFSVALSIYLMSINGYSVTESEMQIVNDLIQKNQDYPPPSIYPVEWAKLKWAEAAYYHGLVQFRSLLEYSDKALESVKKAISIFTAEKYPIYFGRLKFIEAQIYRVNEDEDIYSPQKELEALHKALDVFDAEKLPTLYFEAQMFVGRLHANQGDYERAYECFSKALNTISEHVDITSELFMNRLQSLAQWSLTLIPFVWARTGRLREAVYWFDNLFNSALNFAIDEGNSESQEGGNSAVFSQFATRMLDLGNPLDKLNSIKAIDRSLFADRQKNVTPQFQVHLSKNTLLASKSSYVVIPLFSSEKCIILLIPPNGIEKDVIVSNEIDFGFGGIIGLITGKNQTSEGWLRALFGFRNLTQEFTEKNRDIINKFDDAFENYSSILWEAIGSWLVKSVPRQVKANKKPSVVFCASGLLSFFPLHAIKDKSHKYLIDDFNVSYTYSLSMLKRSESIQNAEKAENSIAIVKARVDENIKFSEEEEVALKAIFEQSNGKSIEVFNVNYDKLKESLVKAEYWHFSVHGEWDPQDANKSFLKVGDDFKLQIAHILSLYQDMKFPPRLVFLSACETGMTDVLTRFYEFSGFPQAFLKLKTPVVISTLWPVADIAAYLFSTYFYYQHKVKQKLPIKAFGNSQRWLKSTSVAEINDFINNIIGVNSKSKNRIAHFFKINGWQDSMRPFEHVYFWAAFTLYGY